MLVDHPYPAPRPATLTGYQRELLRRIAERGTTARICRGMTGSIVDGIADEIDRLWSWGLIVLRSELGMRTEPVYVLTDSGRAALPEVP
jgi:hypothetical protein